MPKANNKHKIKEICTLILGKPYMPSVVYSLLFALLWLKPRLSSLSYGNLDPSYIYGVEKAALNHISFGNHFIATYGPLGYAANNFLAQNDVKMMIWEVAAVVAAGFGVYALSKLYLITQTRYSRILLSILLLFALSLATPEWLYLDIFLLYILIYIRGKGTYRDYLTVILPIIAALLTLVEFTIGATTIVAFLLAIIFQVSKSSTIGYKAKRLIIVSLIYLLLLTSIAYLLGTTNIFDYFVSNLRMSSGFSDAMSLTSPLISIGTKYFFLALAALVVWLVVKLKREAINYIFLVPVLYVVWKYAIARQDGHILIALEVIPVLILIVAFSVKKLTFSDGLLTTLILVLSVMAIWSTAIPYDNYDAQVASPLNNVKTLGVIKFFEVGEQQRAWIKQTNLGLATAKLPASMLSIIGKSGVDVFPWEASIIQANNLTWDNRPSPFSFETYTPQFDEANAKFFDTSGSQFIVWHSFGSSGINGIDYRNILWDEPKTLGSILEHYKYVASNNSFVLLERTNKPDEDQAYGIITSSQKIGSNWTRVPRSSALICASISIHNTPIEYLKSLLVRERPFYMQLQYQNGTLQQYRFVRETAPDGLLINQLPLNWQQLINLLKFHQSSNVVQQFKVIGEPSTTVSYRSCLG